MDTVFIRGLEVSTIIGCYDYEKLQAQTILLDIEMAWDIRQAAASDALSDTLDYDAVRKRVELLCSEKRFELVEALVEHIAEIIMQEFSVEGIRICLAKPQAIENTKDVGVVISRGVSF